MPAADEETKVEDAGTNTREEENGAVVKSAEVTQEKIDQPNPEPPQADEFGLPVRPPRRRQVSDASVYAEAKENGENEEKIESNGAGEEEKEANGVNHSQEEPAVETKVEEVPSEETESKPNRPRKATLDDIADRPRESEDKPSGDRPSSSSGHKKQPSMGVSEWSHQQLAPHEAVQEEPEKEEEWQAMPAFATHKIYDDWGKVLAKEYDEMDDDQNVGYSNLGGAGKGYTRVQIDEDAQSATSMDDNTAYLFKEPHATNMLDEDEEGRDIVSQMQATKEFLTEGQRIAYVGVVRLSIGKMMDELNGLGERKAAKKQIDYATEAMKMWGQKMMVRLYSHMEIDSAEQVMVEQLAEHGVLPSDLTPALMQNAHVKNPANNGDETSANTSARPSISSPTPSAPNEKSQSTQSLSAPSTPAPQTPAPPSPADEAPPAYEAHTADELTVQKPEDIEDKKNLDIDIRWTVLCDMFLLLIADSTYDARSRTLLEHVGSALSVDWQEVCRFEKRITDALEMQEQGEKENWDEQEHLEARKKAARKKRLMVMGLCTVGGGLIIGLSAGALAPVIGAGLAAGFTGIGVAGTSTFLTGTGAAALIGGGGALTGGIVGVRASNRRTGAVKTFEYRPLFNNKRPNLIITVAGWMTGNVDDVRLPFSTVDPIMGDIYSIHWEPEMLQSTGQTIQILATEALTQTIQQILGATLLTTLMAGLSMPIVLTKLSYLIDNPWTVSLARADATGLILADSLIDRNLGVRPITLTGFSLGSRVIFSCLKELARRGALGIVQNAYLFGSPVIAKKEEYTRARTVVSGRFVNGYATNDWILGYLFRATSGGIMRVSGLSSIDVPGIENKDVTELVPGHMAYRGMMPTLLHEVGWLVEDLEFTEIEDPDPESHEKRQRELINEIEAARQELEEKQNTKRGGLRSFFSRKKAPQKKEWETYDERSQQKVLEGDERESERVVDGEGAGVMFDVEAIRKEALQLALQGGDIEEIKRHLSVRELESTLPALKIDSGAKGGDGDGGAVRQTKSLDMAGPSQGETNGDPGPSSKPTDSDQPSTVPSTNGHNSPVPESSSSSRPKTPDPSKAERPLLRTAATAPVASSPVPEIKSPEHNPWGEEAEVEMSFE